jgi:lipopolysaccharide export system permease protein
MKIIDRYLVKQFIQTIIFSLATFTIIFIILDLIEKLDDFIDESITNEIIFQYYIYFIPEMIWLMIPVSVLLASLFVAGKMSSLNELTAIQSAGVSLYRYMAPFIIVSLFIGITAIFFGGYVVPTAWKQKAFIEREYMKKGVIHSGSNIFFQDSRTRIVSISTYNVNTRQAYKVSIQEFDPEDITKMTLRWDAPRMRYDSSKQAWNLFNGSKRFFSDGDEKNEEFIVEEIEDLSFTPDQVLEKQRKTQELTLTELKNLAANQLRSGTDPTRILIEYHSRFAFAFACVITVLFGLPISANKRRGGLALQFGINLLITFVYLVFMQISKSFGKNGVMDPILTAWFANIVFLIAAVINLIRTRR